MSCTYQQLSFILLRTAALSCTQTWSTLAIRLLRRVPGHLTHLPATRRPCWGWTSDARYIQGVSTAVRDIFERFDFAVHIEKLRKVEVLYQVAEKFEEAAHDESDHWAAASGGG